jgi:hypothetical protein
MNLNIPTGWRVRGALPEFSGDDVGNQDLDALEEDLIQISDPQGAFTLDVGWYPAGQAIGQFVCRLVEARDWDVPLEEYSTKDLPEVAEWINTTAMQVAGRLGEPAELTQVPVRKARLIQLAAQLAPSLEDQSTGKTAEPQGPRRKLPQANVSHIAKSFAVTN